MGRWTFLDTLPHGISLDELQTLWGLFVDKKTPVKNGLDRSINLRKLGLTFHLDNFEELNDWIAILEQLKSLGADVLFRVQALGLQAPHHRPR
jgi:hypothetical protein